MHNKSTNTDQPETVAKRLSSWFRDRFSQRASSRAATNGEHSAARASVGPAELQRYLEELRHNALNELDALKASLKDLAGEQQNTAPHIEAKCAELRRLDQILAHPAQSYSYLEAELNWQEQHLSDIAECLPSEVIFELESLCTQRNLRTLTQRLNALSVPSSFQGKLDYMNGRLAEFSAQIVLAHSYYLEAVKSADDNWVYLTRAGLSAMDITDYQAAKHFLRQAANVAVQSETVCLTRSSVSFNNLGLLYKKTGYHDEALSCFARAVKGFSATLDAEHPAVAEVMVNQAASQQERGEFEKAEDLYNRAMEIQILRSGPDSLAVSRSCNNLGTLYCLVGRHSEADPHFRRALTIRDAHFGPTHPEVDIPIANLAEVQLSLGHKTEAEVLFIRLIELRQSLNGPADLSMVRPLIALADIYAATQHFRAAKDLYTSALNVFETSYGRDLSAAPASLYPQAAHCSERLAMIYSRLKQFDEAERILKSCCRMCKHLRGAAHPDLAKSLTNLARFYAQIKRIKEAKQLLKQALTILQQTYPLDDPRVMMTHNSLSALSPDSEA